MKLINEIFEKIIISNSRLTSNVFVVKREIIVKIGHRRRDFSYIYIYNEYLIETSIFIIV